MTTPSAPIVTKLEAVPGTRWVARSGIHKNAVVIIERETNGKVWFHRDRNVRAGGWAKDKTYWLWRMDFYSVYTPYTAEDRRIAAGEVKDAKPLPVPTVSPEVVARTEEWLKQRAAQQVAYEQFTKPSEPLVMHDPALTKRCSACGEVKPRTEFNIDRSAKQDGNQRYCKPCEGAWKKTRRERKEQMVKVVGGPVMPMPQEIVEEMATAVDKMMADSKRCTRCSEVKPLDAFAWARKATGKRHSTCKACGVRLYRERYANGATTPEPAVTQTMPVVTEQDVTVAAHAIAASLKAEFGYHLPLWRVHTRKTVVVDDEVVISAPNLRDAYDAAAGEGIEILGIVTEKPA